MAQRPCRCGSTDHCRISNKNCPVYQPRLKRKRPPEDNQGQAIPETSVTTCVGLSRIILQQDLQATIQDNVQRATDLVCEASRLLVGFAVRWIEMNDSHANFPDIRFEGPGGLMRQFFTAVAANPSQRPYDSSIRNLVRCEHINTFADIWYRQCRPQNLPWIDIRGMSHMVSNIAHMHSTNCKMHIATNLPHKLKLWLVHKFRKNLQHLLGDEELFLLASYVMELLNHPLGNTNLIRFPQSVIDSVDDVLDYSLLFGCVDFYTSKARDYILGGHPLDDMDTNWHLFVPSMARILKTFVSNQDADVEERLLSRRRGCGIRLFTLLPISSYQQKHILVDTQVLRDLLIQSNNGLAIPSRGDFQRDAQEWWNRCFDLSHVTSQNRRFGFSISTDGLKCSVHLMRPRRSRSNVNEYGFSYDGNGYVPLDIDNNTRIVGLDPNRGIFFDAEWEEDLRLENNYRCNPNENGKTGVTFTNKRWQEITGMRYVRGKIKAWDTHNRLLAEMLKSTPTPCCHLWEDFQYHLIHFLEMRDDFLGYYREKRWRRLRWRSFMQRQKAYDEVGKIITGRNTSGYDRNTVVVYGGGSFDHASCGHPATPNKQLLKELKARCRVRLCPEFRTSKLCSNCEGVLKQTRVWRIKQCENICLTTWHRDVNAARNIRYIWIYRNEHRGDRPFPFTY